MKKWIMIFAAAVFAATVTAGCARSGSNETAVNQDVSVQELHEAVKAAYGDNYIPDQALDDGGLENILGVEPGLCEEYIAEMPMISMNVDTFAAIRAKKGKGEQVKEALEAYREKLVADTMQYPMNQIKIQASKVAAYDDYVFFIMLGFLEPEQEEQEESAVLKAYEEENDKAVQAIEELLKVKG